MLLIYQAASFIWLHAQRSYKYSKHCKYICVELNWPLILRVCPEKFVSHIVLNCLGLSRKANFEREIGTRLFTEHEHYYFISQLLRAAIGQLSGPHSRVQPAKLTNLNLFLPKTGLNWLPKCFMVYLQVFLTFIASKSLKSSFYFKLCIKTCWRLNNDSNWLVFLSTCARNFKPFRVNRNRSRTRQTHSREI